MVSFRTNFDSPKHFWKLSKVERHPAFLPCMVKHEIREQVPNTVNMQFARPALFFKVLFSEKSFKISRAQLLFFLSV